MKVTMHKCPVCGAEENEQCRTPQGVTTLSAHDARPFSLDTDGRAPAPTPTKAYGQLDELNKDLRGKLYHPTTWIPETPYILADEIGLSVEVVFEAARRICQESKWYTRPIPRGGFKSKENT